MVILQISAEVSTVENLQQGIFVLCSSVRQKVTAVNVDAGIFFNGEEVARRERICSQGVLGDSGNPFLN